MYLFCVRHFNDVDHITPIVWKMKQDNYSVAVYCINPRYDIDNDYRLNFLKNQGVIVESIYDIFDQKQNVLHRSMRFLFLWFFAKGRKFSSHNQDKALPLSRLSQLASEIIGRMFYELTRLGFYHTKWAFDHILPRRYVVGALLNAAKEKSVPTLALPHGVYLYTNESYKARTSAGQRFYKFNRFDYVIVQNHLRKDVLVRAGIASEKIVVLGSARFCAEWIAQNRNILPRKMNADPQSKKLKVVFMVSKPQCRIDIERMLSTFNLLSNFGDIEVMLKPHTRTVGNNRLFANVALPNVSDILTPELCEWADVVLVIGSSVITEALMQGKPVLYLKYLHANTMLFEELGACWTIGNEAELEHALQSLRLNKTDLPYRDQDVERFLSAVVYGGRNERDVLKDYVRFITNCTTN
jgi:hypothetical protein